MQSYDQRRWRVVVVPAIVLALAVCDTVSYAQYPRVPKDVQEEAIARQAAADRRSDEAWERALPVIREWETKGKPYIPWAAKPDDLPSAPIPAFPGAEGGGMYSFGGRGGRVWVVTQLGDRGPGSFREALEAGGPTDRRLQCGRHHSLEGANSDPGTLRHHRRQQCTGRRRLHRG